MEEEVSPLPRSWLQTFPPWRDRCWRQGSSPEPGACAAWPVCQHRVQIMGAEKSLFKHLKGNAPFQTWDHLPHPAVYRVPKRSGERYRARLAGKLAIAAGWTTTERDVHGSVVISEHFAWMTSNAEAE